MKELLYIINSFKEEYVELFRPLLINTIEKFEHQFRVKLLQDYIEFLKITNGILIDGDEVLGIDNKKVDLKEVYYREHNLVKFSMPDVFIPFSPDGGGNYYCFDTSSGKIIFWQSNFDYQQNKVQPEVANNTFTEWLKEVMIDWTIENNNESLFKEEH